MGAKIESIEINVLSESYFNPKYNRSVGKIVCAPHPFFRYNTVYEDRERNPWMCTFCDEKKVVLDSFYDVPNKKVDYLFYTI